MIIPETLCIWDVVEYIVTQKNGSICSKSIHCIPPVPLTAEPWLQKDIRDENGFPLLKELLLRKLTPLGGA